MDVVIRAAIVFAVLFLVIRVSGKRQIAQMSAFDLIFLVTVGDLIGQTVMQEDYSLTGGILAVSTFGLLAVTLSYAGWRFPKLRPVVEGSPVIVVRDGEPDIRALSYERIPLSDLDEACREQGVRDIRDVELAVLETDGAFSFFMRHSSSDDDDDAGEDPDDSEGAARDSGPIAGV